MVQGTEMEGSNLIYIPYKSSVEIPLSQTLKDVISNEFYQSPSAFDTDLTSLHNLRNKVIKILYDGSCTIDLDLILLKEYYCQLCYIERKFPRDSVEFTWLSNNLSYQPTNRISLKSFQFEKLNVLYNIGSLFSQFAFKQDRSDLEGLKRASLHFQNAAGVFDGILDFLPQIKDFQIPLEYSVETITGLKFLMLAQAQEAYWQRAISSSSDKVVAILSQQVGEFYRASYDGFNKSQFILRSEFLNHISCKSLHFLAATHYRMAQHEYALANYGSQVAHLRKANENTSKGLKSTKGVSEVVVDDLRGLDDTVKKTLKTAEKENDLIYHKDVPRSLTTVAARPMVKAIPLAELENPIRQVKEVFKSKLLFENLLPYIVIQSAQAFKERQEEFVANNLISPVNTLTKILKEFISDRSLPAAFDSITKPQRLPDSLLQHCQDLLSNDALSKLKRSLNDLNRLNAESRELVEGCKERLEIEAAENHSWRESQGSKRWTRLSSEEASAELHDKIAHYEQYLSQAASGDDTVRHNLTEIKPYLEMMTNAAIPGNSGKEKLKKFIPMSSLVELSPELVKVIKDLKDVLSESANEINKRASFIEAVELKSRESSVLPKIISEYRLIQQNENAHITEETFEPVFSKHLKNFDNDLKNLYLIRDGQALLEQKIDQLNKKFVSISSGITEQSTARKEALQTLEEAYNGYQENLENVSEGLNFYRDFIDNVQALLKQCDDFVYQRRVEGRELEAKLNAPVPATPVKASSSIRPPSSVSQQKFKTTFSDDESEEATFYTDDDDSFERNVLFVKSDGSKSPLKQKRANDGSKVVTRAEEENSPEIRRARKTQEKPAFWDPKQGIQFE